MNKSLDKLQKKIFPFLLRLAHRAKKLKSCVRNFFFHTRKAAFISIVAVYPFCKTSLNATDPAPSYSQTNDSSISEELTIQSLQQELADTRLRLQKYKCNLFSLNNPQDKEKINELAHLLTLKERHIFELAFKLRSCEEELAHKNGKLGNSETIIDSLTAMIKAKNSTIEESIRSYQENIAALKLEALTDQFSQSLLLDGYDALYRDIKKQNLHLANLIEEVNNQKEISALLADFNHCEKIQGFAEFYEQLQTADLIAKSAYNELTALTATFEKNLDYLHDLLLYDDLLVQLQEDLKVKEDSLLAFNIYLTSKIQENAENVRRLQSARLMELSINEEMISLSQELHQKYHEDFVNSMIPTIHDLMMYEELLGIIEENIRLKDDAMLALHLYSTAKFDDYSHHTATLQQAFFNELLLNEGLLAELSAKNQTIDQNLIKYQHSHQLSKQLFDKEFDHLQRELQSLAHEHQQEKEWSLLLADSLSHISEEKEEWLRQKGEASHLLDENTHLKNQLTQIAPLQSKNEELTLLSLALENEIATLSELSEEILTFQAQNEQLKNRIDELTKTAEDYDLMLSLNVQLHDKIEALALLNDENEKFRHADRLEANQLAYQLENLSAILMESEQSLALKQLELEKKDHRFIELQAKNDQLHRLNILKEEADSLAPSVQQHHQLMAENTQLKTQIDELSRSFEEQAQLLALNHEKMQKQEEEKIELASASESIDALNTALIHKINDLEETAAGNFQKLEILSQEQKELISANDKRKASDLEEMVAENLQLKQELEALSKEHKEWVLTSQEQELHHSDRFKELKEENENFLSMNTLLKDQIHHLEQVIAENDRLKDQLETSFHKIKEQEILISANQQQKQLDDEQFDEIYKENEQLKSQIHSLSETVKGQDQLALLNHEQSQKHAEQIHFLTQQNEALKEQFKALSQNLKAQEEFIATTTYQNSNQFNDLRKEKEQVLAQNTSLRNKIDRLAHLAVENTQLRKQMEELSSLAKEQQTLSSQRNEGPKKTFSKEGRIPPTTERSTFSSKFSRIAQLKNNANQKKRISTPSISNKKAHIVQEGESLQDIATIHYGRPNRWEDIYEANSDKIEEGTRVMPGIILTIPD